MQSFITQSVKEIRNNLKGKDWRIKNQIPYLKYRELEIFMEIFLNKKPSSILEWGAGFSTLYFPRRLNYSFQWVSVEHDEQWYEQLMLMNSNKNVRITLKKPHCYPYSDEHGDGSYEDFKDYIESPGNTRSFDFIIIDGRARNECLLKSLQLLNSGGIVLLHDANRKRYHKNLGQFRYQEFFLDYRRSAGGIWLGSMDTDLNDVIDIRKHLKRWSLVRNKVAKILSV